MALFPVRLVGVSLALALSASRAAEPTEPPGNAFAFALYAELAKSKGNLFLSPFSITTALAMAAEGSRGETATEFAQLLESPAHASAPDAPRRRDWTALHESLSRVADRLTPTPLPPAARAELDALREELAEANASLARATSQDDAPLALSRRAETLAEEINQRQRAIDPTEFRSANAVWLDQGFTPEKSYLDTLARHYRSGGAYRTDFRGAPEAARLRINDWVADRTAQRIRDLLAPGMVDADTRLVLTNAVYFVGEWLEPFDTARTRTEPFFAVDSTGIEVAMMRGWKREGAKYAAFAADGTPFATPEQIDARSADASGRYPEDGFQLVELPYRGGKLAMQLIVPLRRDGLRAIEAALDADALAGWDAALETRKVDLALPKFTLETGFELSTTLQALGLRRAFVAPGADGVGAEFDGIQASDDPAQGLYIGAVVHKVFVQFDEKGTEAAAATAVTMLAGAALPTMVDFVPAVRADRPFLFLVREKASGAVIFLGRIARP